jgi:hypothetical protein
VAVNTIRCFFFLLPILLTSVHAFSRDCYSPGSAADQHQESFVKKVPAFPGAMGGGRYTSGGRGGKVLKVTNLNDAGQGSLRSAIETPGPRTIIFDISGTISLLSPMIVRHNDLTLAGQTAPGDGICVSGHEFRIAADNVIIRYMRFRPGDQAGAEYDALTGIGQKNIIIDHCSMSWSTDETVSFYNNQNFTLQWCIISESLNKSAHSKGAHGYGGIWGGKNASFVFNLLAHHNSRNPRLQGARSYDDSANEKSEIAYNIIYNWEKKAMYGGERGRYNIICNLFIPGPATSESASTEILEPYTPHGQFYIHGNILEGHADVSNDNWTGVGIPSDMRSFVDAGHAFSFDWQLPTKTINQVYNAILKHAGASLTRDPVDIRILQNLEERAFTYGNKGIIDSQGDTSGWPELESFSPPKDTDGDGMPDDWEILHGLNPHSPLDGNTHELEPDYTNLEMYLNDFNL